MWKKKTSQDALQSTIACLGGVKRPPEILVSLAKGTSPTDSLGYQNEIRMKDCPDTSDHARAIMSTPIDAGHEFTHACNQIVADKCMGPMAGLAICQYKGETAYYLLGCDEEWNTITDTCHQSLLEALDQAEFEYPGTKHTWIRK